MDWRVHVYNQNFYLVGSVCLSVEEFLFEILSEIWWISKGCLCKLWTKITCVLWFLFLQFWIEHWTEKSMFGSFEKILTDDESE